MHSSISLNFHYRLHYEEAGVIWKLSTFFLQHIPFDHPNLVFCCIGTDRSTGDSLGPLTGSRLNDSILFPFPVIGTLETPLHALNLQQNVNKIAQEHLNPYVIAIDACLGKVESIGQISVQNGAIYPGQGVGKNLPPIGDIAIKGIVNVAGFMAHTVLQNTRLHLPYEMSRVIARAMQLAYSRSKSNIVKNRHDNRYNTYSRN